MTMNIARAFLAASALFTAMTFDAVSGFNAASAADCTPGTVERDGHQVETKCDPATGVLIRQLWLKGDKRDRADGPAFVLNDLKAGVGTEVWWKNDIRHRDDGPALINRNLKDGSITIIGWFKDGQSFIPSAEVQDAWLKKSGERYVPPSFSAPHIP